MNNFIEEAVKYTMLGFSVIPLGEITKNEHGKKEIQYLKSWKEYQERIATPEEIKEWKALNIGIVTGPVSKLLVVDVDYYKDTFDKDLLSSLMLPITPVQTTASGGKQYFFRYPDGVHIKNDVCIGSEGSGIDIRAEGGMVIAPPSKTSYGEYSWEISPWDEALAEVPPELLKMLNPVSTEATKKSHTLPELIGLKEGDGRNNAMASFAGTLLRVIPETKWATDVWHTMEEVNRTYQPPMERRELETIFLSIAKAEKNSKSKTATVLPSDYVPAMTHAELISKKFPEARYSLKPFFEQGSINMISAPPNTWKSWLIFLFAKHIASGTTALDMFEPTKARVMIVNEEDGARLVQDRLKMLNVADPDLPIYYRISQGSKLAPEFMEQLLKEALEKHVGVIFFDSLRAVHDADENSSTEMQKVMDMLKVITRADITVVFTHHHRKSSQFNRKDDSESSRGSSAINAAVNGHISLSERLDDMSDNRILTVQHLKSKVGEKLKPFEIVIQKSGEMMEFEYAGESAEKEKVKVVVKEKILNALGNSGEWLCRKDFFSMKITGQKTIIAALEELEIERKVIKTMRNDLDSDMRVRSPDGKANEYLYFKNNVPDAATLSEREIEEPF